MIGISTFYFSGHASLAARVASAAAPDGSPLYQPVSSTFVALHPAAPNVPLKVPRDFLPIGFVSENPTMLAVRATIVPIQRRQKWIRIRQQSYLSNIRMTSHQRVVNDDPDYFTIEGTSQRRGIGLGAIALQGGNARRAGNSAIRDIWLLPPDNPKLYAGRKIAVVATDGVEEIRPEYCPALFPVARCA